jgi:hypothetical protein
MKIMQWSRFACALAIGCIAAVLAARSTTAQTPPAAPSVEALPPGWQEIDQRLLFLTSELAGNEASLDAVGKAMIAAGYQKAATTQKADQFVQNNIAMDRNGGGPIPWQQFYGKTASDFYYRPTSKVDTTNGGHTGNENTHVDANGPEQLVDRPPQLDYLYKANAESAQQAEAEAAKLGKQLDKLTARRRELETEQSALWCKISFRAVTSLDLADKPLYLFDPNAADDDKAEEQEAAMSAGRDFVRLAVLAVDWAQKNVDIDQTQTYDRLQQVVSGSQSNLEKLLLKERQLTAEMSDARSPLALFVKAAKRLGDTSQNMIDATKLAAASDAAGDDDRKNNLRGVLQQNVMDFASTMITADKTLSDLATEWKVTPDRRHEAAAIALPVMQTAPARAAAPRAIQGPTIILVPAGRQAVPPPVDNMAVDVIEPGPNPAANPAPGSVHIRYSHGGTATLGILKLDELIYTNRDYKITLVPQELEGLTFTQRPVKVVGANSNCVVDVPAGSTLYLLFLEAGNIPTLPGALQKLKDAGWTPVDDIEYLVTGSTDKSILKVFKKDFPGTRQVRITDGPDQMFVAAKGLTQ